MKDNILYEVACMWAHLCSKKQLPGKKFFIFTGKYPCWSLFLSCMSEAHYLMKKDSNTGVFQRILWNFYKHLFYIEHLQWLLLCLFWWCREGPKIRVRKFRKIHAGNFEEYLTLKYNKDQFTISCMTGILVWNWSFPAGNYVFKVNNRNTETLEQ